MNPARLTDMSCPSRPEGRRVPRVLLLMALLATVLCGCQQAPPWRTRSIAYLMPDLAFSLTRQDGRSVQAADYQGKVVLLFFGFSNCQMTCPATLGRLSAVLEKMGKRADQVRVLFVSIDPNRDTPARLATYTRAFAPQVVGLTGTKDQLLSLTRRYRAAFSYGGSYPRGNYAVYHSGAVFVFDNNGRVRLLFTQSDGIGEIRDDLSRLLTLQPAA